MDNGSATTRRARRARSEARADVGVMPARSSSHRSGPWLVRHPVHGRRNSKMRFMMIIKANKDTEAGVMPEEKTLAAMAKFNQRLADAGVMLDGAGLQPSEKGARVRFSGGKPTVIDGPFGEPRDLIAGFWMIQVKSKQEAI